MTSKIRTVVMSVAMTFVALSLLAETVVTSVCKAPDKDRYFVVIDANTGQITEGASRFPEGAQVQVIIEKKNPFKYVYSITIKSTPLAPAIAGEFLKLVPGLAAILEGAREATSTALAMRDSARGRSCADQDVNDLMSLVDSANDLSENIEDDINARLAANVAYEAFVTQTDFEEVICDDTVSDAENLLQQLPILVSLDSLGTDIEDLRTVMSDLATGIDDNSATECQDVLGNIKASAKELQIALQSNEAAVALLQDNKASFEKMETIIRTVLARDDAFFEVHYPQTTDEPTGVSIAITRTNLRVDGAQAQPVADLLLQIGKSRISFSAGIGLSTIQKSTFERQSGLVPDDQGGMVLGSVFGTETASTFRISAMAMLNASLAEFHLGPVRSSFAISSGIGVGTGTTGLEFVIGPSLGFLNDAVFLTFGFTAAQVEELGGGFSVGDPVPDGLTDPLPVVKSLETGFMFVATYKLR